MIEGMIKTPFFVVDEEKLLYNLRILKTVREKSGCKILLSQKAFSMYSTYPIISKYLDGTSASGYCEAKLSDEYFEGENHVYEAAFSDDEFPEICQMCDHIVFNSLSQLERHREVWELAKSEKELHIGIRINPEFRTHELNEVYDPCAPGSRFGIRKDIFNNMIPEGVDGIHFHALCEQNFEPLHNIFRNIETNFGWMLKSDQIKWINLGGGHHITRDDYDIISLINFIREIKVKYHLDVYMEPGEAVAIDAGRLVTTVLDIVEASDMNVIIVDASASCHMPDVVEMPYRPPIKNAGEKGEKKYTYRVASKSCLAGDVMGFYSFDNEIQIGDKLEFEDMAMYSMVKTNTFNGMKLPTIAYKKMNGDCQIVKEFGYEDFKSRL
ncbi:MAG: carboxynorspermidine decarboxylase [Butyrivibrio sp.]|nr:carboxynorspermidine decarboxylase [Butyrivibrio sp.]